MEKSCKENISKFDSLFKTFAEYKSDYLKAASEKNISLEEESKEKLDLNSAENSKKSYTVYDKEYASKIEEPFRVDDWDALTMYTHRH